MLIIFDLDDTLIDTSGSVTPFKLKRVIEILLGSFDAASFQRLHSINQSMKRTQDAILAYAKEVGADTFKIKTCLEELTKPLPDDFQIPTTPNAKEIISYYAKKAHLALVTGGYPPFQREKAEKAGLELSIFSKIAIPEDSQKGSFYRDFAKEFLADPKDVWVCGDRVSVDLEPARDAGFRTIQMRWGRGEKEPICPWFDATVRDLNELRSFIP